MTQDHPELPQEVGHALGRLGRVTPPDPAVLDAAREILWAAVAAKMLPGETARAAGQADAPGRTDSRRAQREAGRRQASERETSERETSEREVGQREAGRPEP